MTRMIVPERWVRITDPELAWLAMVAALEGQKFLGFIQCWENGAVDLCRFEDGRVLQSQASLVGYVKGQRFVVVWRPQEPTRAPEVYFDPTRRSKQ